MSVLQWKVRAISEGFGKGRYSRERQKGKGDYPGEERPKRRWGGGCVCEPRRSKIWQLLLRNAAKTQVRTYTPVPACARPLPITRFLGHVIRLQSAPSCWWKVLPGWNDASSLSLLVKYLCFFLYYMSNIMASSKEFVSIWKTLLHDTPVSWPLSMGPLLPSSFSLCRGISLAQAKLSILYFCLERYIRRM